MDKYGINNVRGGSYSRLELTQEEINVLQKELWGANDLCFLCGQQHFIKDCPNNKQPIIDKLIEDDNYTIDYELLSSIKNNKITSNVLSQNKIGGVVWHCTTLVPSRLIFTNRTHLEEYFSLDNLTITEYVNNNKEIMDLYIEYISAINGNEFLKLDVDQQIYGFGMGHHCLKQSLNRKKIIFTIEDKIKNLIVDVCYFEINKLIQSKYHNDYILTNFNMDINYKPKENTLCETIYFKYFIEDYWKDILPPKSNLYSRNYGPDSVSQYLAMNYLVSKNPEYRNICHQIAHIHIKGELYWKSSD